MRYLLISIFFLSFEILANEPASTCIINCTDEEIEKNQTKEKNESENINPYEKDWKTVERKNSKREVILEYYKGEKLILKSIFSKKTEGGYFVWENLLREEWFDENEKLLVVASNNNVDKKFKYKDYWYSNESASFDCDTNKIGNIIVEKAVKQDDIEVFINTKSTKRFCRGTGSCFTCDYYTQYNDFNINYSPPNEGCFSRHYFPSFHQGTIFISKKSINEDTSDTLAIAIEKNYCQLKK